MLRGWRCYGVATAITVLTNRDRRQSESILHVMLQTQRTTYGSPCCIVATPLRIYTVRDERRPMFLGRIVVALTASAPPSFYSSSPVLLPLSITAPKYILLSAMASLSCYPVRHVSPKRLRYAQATLQSGLMHSLHHLMHVAANSRRISSFNLFPSMLAKSTLTIPRSPVFASHTRARFPFYVFVKIPHPLTRRTRARDKLGHAWLRLIVFEVRQPSHLSDALVRRVADLLAFLFSYLLAHVLPLRLE